MRSQDGRSVTPGGPQGGYKLILVPLDSVHETQASREAGTAYVASRHGGDAKMIMGPFQVCGDISADGRITMSRVFFEENVEVIDPA